MTRDQAIRETHQRLLQIRAGRTSCKVRVITGRGEHTPDGVSVLGPAVESWLQTEGRRMASVSDVHWASDHGSLLVQITIREEAD
ncbi:MAG TPA: hypothetical protein EYQ74_05910 [Planctomycetes bacterium]|nr:hypothetical protein [Planctomycetota bacterium]HIK60251.1 hypothetical protein [Planctomycetota bacterium]